MEEIESNMKALREAMELEDARRPISNLAEIGRKGNAKAIDALIEYGLTSENIKILRSSILALGITRDKRGAEPLKKFIKHENKEVVELAARAFMGIQGKKALPELMKHTGHKDRKVNHVIRVAINDLQRRLKDAEE